MYDDDYIISLKEKMKYIEDKELFGLIDKLINEREYLINFSRIDPLSGLYNRNILNYIRECSCLVICDIDNFKLINDRYGHINGDMVIKEVANILRNNFRIKDYVCRYGGDEFLIGVVQCEKDIVLDRLDNIQKEICNNSILSDMGVTLSIGVAFSYENDKLNDLIERADIALYQSKLLGKNGICVYDDMMKRNLK